MENWKAIPGFDMYEVSDHGRVRNVGKTYIRTPFDKDSHAVTIKPRIINPYLRAARPGVAPRYVVGLRQDGKTFDMKVHRLVLLAFVGKPPDGMVCCHYDGNALNNNLDNLRWDTLKSNVADSKRHGTFSPPPNRWLNVS